MRHLPQQRCFSLVTATVLVALLLSACGGDEPPRAATELQELLAGAREGRVTPDSALAVLSRLDAAGSLQAGLAYMAAHEAPVSTQEHGRTPDEAAAIVLDRIRGELWLRGLDGGGPERPYESWDAIAARQVDLVEASAVPRLERSPGSELLLREIAAVAGTRFVPADTVKLLADGDACWKWRTALLDTATETIDVLMWAIYDDVTGHAFIEKLLEKARAGVHVRVVVDEQIAEGDHYDGAVEELERLASDDAAPLPLEVLRWRDPARPFDGQHRKMLIVDGERAIAGGRNIGDAYSHQNPEEKRAWRDTDVYVTGPVVADARALFVRLWNDQIATRELPLAMIEVSTAAEGSGGRGAVQMAVVDHRPGHDEHVLASTVKMFDAARTTIDIENAYFVRMPPIEQALVAAVNRGVRVRILTNSAESCDEPIVAHAILRSLDVLHDAGARIYLQQGQTLHSKFHVVDGWFSAIGSYNLHPRSYRLEGEMMLYALGASTAKMLLETFERDLRAARLVEDSETIQPPDSPVGALAFRFFLDQL